ncbi:hypothetical protein IP92_02215 [Pseudoduganella flava]|nr:hypothetical protein IP92_02215 [Pseudoduganella flava]
MRLFVSTMFETQSMDRAVQHLQPDYDYWHSNEYFYSQFIGFLQKNTRGRGKQRFVEELTSKLLLAQAGDRNAVKMARQMAKNGTKDFEKHFVRLSNVFLHGRNHLSFKQIDEYAEKWPVY